MKGVVPAVLIVGFLTICSSASAKPGVDIRLTRNGLTYAGQIGANILGERIVQGQIPDVVGRTGLIHYNISHISVSGIETLHSNISEDLSKGLTWIFQNVSFDVTAKLSVSFCIFKSLGSVEYSVGNTSIYLPLSIGVDKTGRPTLTSSCHYAANNALLSFFGQHANFFNWAARTFRGVFYGFIQKLVCSAITSQVNKGALEFFSKFQTKLPVGSLFTVDYSMLTSPTYNTTYMDLPLKGETFWTKRRASSTVPVPDLPPLTDESRMMYVFVTDYVFNTLSQVAFKQERLDKTLTYTDLPPDQQYFLNTTCPGNLCFGKLIAQTAQLFPNSRAELHMKSSEMPVVSISPNSVSVTFAANINFYARRPSGNTTYMFSIKTRLDTQLHLISADIPSHNRLTAAINQTSLSVGILDSAIGAINLNLLNTLMDTIVSLYVRPQLNKLLSFGFPLPQFGKNVTYRNIQILLAQNAVIIGTDIKYVKEETWRRSGYKLISLKSVDKQNKQSGMSFQAVDGSNKRHPIKFTRL